MLNLSVDSNLQTSLTNFDKKFHPRSGSNVLSEPCLQKISFTSNFAMTTASMVDTAKASGQRVKLSKKTTTYRVPEYDSGKGPISNRRKPDQKLLRLELVIKALFSGFVAFFSFIIIII